MNTPQGMAHFTFTKSMEGGRLSRLRHLVKVCSRCPRLYISAALVINTTVHGELRIWVLAHHSRLLCHQTTAACLALCESLIDCCVDRSPPGDLSDDDYARDYQDFSSNDELSDIDAGDERPTHLSKLHATRLNFSSQVCCFRFLSLSLHAFLSQCCKCLKSVVFIVLQLQPKFIEVKNMLHMNTLRSYFICHYHRGFQKAHEYVLVNI